ncbi:hypothetical protein ACFQ7B_41510 [Streptomyces erythrochromogenes]|uniref:hypothetical protein n=1 Tax=Streptomyces erythrochromogenes TaxID=285574 RepID=UPI0036C69FEA
MLAHAFLAVQRAQHDGTAGADKAATGHGDRPEPDERGGDQGRARTRRDRSTTG